MKKIFSTAVAILSIASASVFGMYGVDNDWIDFLTDGNQFKARLETLGFTLGNDTIKGTFGFDSPDMFGGILSTFTDGNQHVQFIPTISMGLAYTSPLISVGVGYNATIRDQTNRTVQNKARVEAAHTPVLALNALDNNLRIVVPVQVYSGRIGSGFVDNAASVTNEITAVSLDPQIRYYTGIDAFSQIRLVLKYGMYQDRSRGAGTTSTTTKYESFGFQFRAYFLATTIEEVSLSPYLRIDYNTAIGRNHTNTSITAVGHFTAAPTGGTYDTSAYVLSIKPALGLEASSDIVTFYLEPAVGLRVHEDGTRSSKTQLGLGWNVYGELYITPVPNLEWYFEADIGNDGIDPSNTGNTGTVDYNYPKNDFGIGFAASTGITWYLPAL